MPSYCGEYSRSAKHRPEKLARSIRSVMRQSFTDWELLIIADNCEITIKTAIPFMQEDPRVKCYTINKQPSMNAVGQVRNAGLKYANGDVIVYLDNDDIFGPDHLSIINRQLSVNYDWFFFNDCTYSSREDLFIERQCTTRHGQCGTSNIAHFRELGIKWDDYAAYSNDDWRFIQKLMKYKLRRIETPEYFVCHIPKLYDV